MTDENNQGENNQGENNQGENNQGENNQSENNASRARSSKATRHLRRVEAVGAGAAEIPDSRADAEEGLASGGEVSSPKLLAA
jgi:hypothetical protein